MYKRLEEVFVEFAKNPLRLEALKTALAKVYVFPFPFPLRSRGSFSLSPSPLAIAHSTPSNGKVTIVEADTDIYWRYGTDSFEMVYKKSNFECWLTSYTVDELESKLSVDWEGNAVSLPAKVSIANAEKAIEGYLAAISTAVGKVLLPFFLPSSLLLQPITLAPGFYPRLYTACASETNAKGAQFGKSVDAILKQAANCITAFCKNADNKEALADAWKSGKFDFDYNDGSWVYWSWKDGSLIMQVKKGNLASWLDSYNPSVLESTL